MKGTICDLHLGGNCRRVDETLRMCRVMNGEMQKID